MFANRGESLDRNGTEIADRRATSKSPVTHRLDDMTLDEPTNDQSENKTVHPMRSPETKDNDHWVIYESMEKTTLSRTPSFRAHNLLQPKTGYNPPSPGPTGELQNALNTTALTKHLDVLLKQPSARVTFWTATSVRMTATSPGMCTL